MNRHLAASLALVLVSATAAAAQATTADSTVAKFAGVWEGSYTSDHMPPGGMRLALVHDTTWTADMSIVVDQAVQSTATSIKVDGNRMSWGQQIMGMACQTTAALDSGTLKGQIDCGGHAAVSFELKRRPKMSF